MLMLMLLMLCRLFWFILMLVADAKNRGFHHLIIIIHYISLCFAVGSTKSYPSTTRIKSIISGQSQYLYSMSLAKQFCERVCKIRRIGCIYLSKTDLLTCSQYYALFVLRKKYSFFFNSSSLVLWLYKFVQLNFCFLHI